MRNRKYWTAALCLGVATLLEGGALSAAEAERQQTGEAKARMQAEGWKEISPNVFERHLGPAKVEHLGYGREGLSWTVGDLNRKIERLQREYKSYPSQELANIIADLTVKSTNARRGLWNMDQSSSGDVVSMIGAVTGPSCSNICYSATADAYYFTATQGVAAVADAKFNSTCGYSGSTNAYTYARATLGTTTTTITQSDPKSGTNVNSHAVASANGGEASGIPCYSEASASAESSALGIYYSTSDTNSSCPPVSCSVTITGTSYEYFISPGGGGCRSRTWTASASSGCNPATYQWTINGVAAGTGSTYTQSVCPATADFTLGVTVNGVASDTHFVDVEREYCECCNTQYPCN